MKTIALFKAFLHVISSICFHHYKITDIHFEVPSANYNNVYFDIYYKECKCGKRKKVLKPFTAIKCKVEINDKILMDGLKNKYYL